MMIRPVMPSDINKLLDLAEIMHSESKYKDLNFDRKKLGRLLIGLMKNHCLVGFVDSRDEKIVGAILSHITDYFFGNDFLLQDIGFYVLPSYRKSKSGSKLLKEWIAVAKKLNVKEVCISTASAIDTSAIDQLYKKVGFEYVGSFYKVKFYDDKIATIEAA